MRNLTAMLTATMLATTALGAASAARAATQSIVDTYPNVPLPYYPLQGPYPGNGVTYSDAWWGRTLVNNPDLGTYAGLREPANPGVNDTFGNTGVGTTAANGVGVVLWDHDLFGTEGGNPNQSDSDYIYAFNGSIYFDSDSENFIPSLTINDPSVNPANFIRMQETGKWQDLSVIFGYAPGTFLVASDVPEPATWATLLLGFGLAGVAMRRGRGAAAARA